ncbi:hypothetical protein ACFLW5_01460 [Chloroflexota bacterium]
MQKCPNCGQTAEVTVDWACRWCGYPLLSRSYKRISQTYQELKEERLRQQGLLSLEEVEVSAPEPELEPVAVLEPEPVAVAEPEPEPEPEPVAPKSKRAPKAKPAPRVKAKSAPKAKAEPKPAPKAKRKPAEKPNPGPEPEPVATLEPEPMAESIPESAAEPELATDAIELTVEELLSAYETDGMAADEKFVGKPLKITGVVDKVEIKDNLDLYYIFLTSAEIKLLQNVRCEFNRQYASELSQLTTGQTAIVQGTYDGSMINLRMKNCMLVN